MKRLLICAAILALLYAPLAMCVCAEDSTEGEAYSDENVGDVMSLTVKSYPDRTIYGAFEHFDIKGMKLCARYADGTVREISSDAPLVTYQQDTCFRVGDSHVFLSYGGATVSIPVTVNRISYDLSELSVSDITCVYNGSFRSIDTPFPAIVGLDGIALSITADGGGCDVGSYEVSVNFQTSSRDYYTPDTRVITLTVEPFETEIVWENLSFVYDGKSKAPVASYIDVFGKRVFPAVVGAAINAGNEYVAKVTPPDSNYRFSNTEASYEIKKADYDFRAVKWSRDGFVYDGSRKSISVSNLPLGVAVVSYVGDYATDAGKYTVTAKLSYDKTNYNTPEPLTHTWEISPASYDISGFRFKAAEYVFDGKIHYPELVGEMPVGADGIRLEYSFSGGACHVSDGTVVSAVNFRTQSKNYLVPESVYSSVSITPKGIDVVWGNAELSYNGESQNPSAVAGECIISVRGGGVDVGAYTAEAYAENTDYYVINSSFTFKILKAENRWIAAPSFTTCYEGRALSFPVESRFGEVSFVFYSDEAGKNEVSPPESAGVYYARAAVSETNNYFGIESGVFKFEIVPVVAVSFFAEFFEREFFAFEKVLPKDILCTVINNDGSKITADPTLVTVIYENGDSLRKNDKYVTLKYGKFNLKLDVSVGYADYDMSAVRWHNTEAVYDGTPKSPTLTGLPDGVSVSGYTGGGQVDAGVYTVGVMLVYDTENYNPPRISDCSFTIRKQLIDFPVISAVYDGVPQIPKSPSPLYRVEEYSEVKNAGKYPVKLRLTDERNYAFINGETTCTAAFVITPRIITLAVEDVTLYLFEKPKEIDYTVASGEIADGDTLSLSQHKQGKNIIFRSENPNYTVVCVGGTIKRLPIPSPIFSIIFILMILLVAGTLLVVYFLFVKRYGLTNAFAVIKCRWKNRRIAVYPPRKKSPFRKAVGTHKTVNGSEALDEEQTAAEPENNDGKDDNEHSESELSRGYDTVFPQSVPSDTEHDDDHISKSENESSTSEEFSACEPKSFGVDPERADSLISDSLAKNLIKKDAEIVYTDGKTKNVINVDTLSENFSSGERVDVNVLKNRDLVPCDTAYVKVLARGVIDKPLSVYANDFSLSAVKMIALTGGEAVKAVTVRVKEKRKNTEKHGKERKEKNVQSP